MSAAAASGQKRKEAPEVKQPAAKRKKTAKNGGSGGKEAKAPQSVGAVADAYRKSLTPFYQTPSDLLTSTMWELYIQRSAYERLMVEFPARIEVSLSHAEETKQASTKIADLAAMQKCRSVMEKYVVRWRSMLELSSTNNEPLRELYFRALASVRSRVIADADNKNSVLVQLDLDAFAFASRHEFRIAPPLRHLINRDQTPVATFIKRFQESTKAMSAETFVIRKSLWKRIRCIQEIGVLDSVIRYHATKWADDHRAAFNNRHRDTAFAVAIDTIHKQHPFSKLHEMYIKLDKDLTAAMNEAPKEAMLVVRKVA